MGDLSRDMMKRIGAEDGTQMDVNSSLEYGVRPEASHDPATASANSPVGSGNSAWSRGLRSMQIVPNAAQDMAIHGQGDQHNPMHDKGNVERQKSTQAAGRNHKKRSHEEYTSDLHEPQHDYTPYRAIPAISWPEVMYKPLADRRVPQIYRSHEVQQAFGLSDAPQEEMHSSQMHNQQREPNIEVQSLRRQRVEILQLQRLGNGDAGSGSGASLLQQNQQGRGQQQLRGNESCSQSGNKAASLSTMKQNERRVGAGADFPRQFGSQQHQAGRNPGSTSQEIHQQQKIFGRNGGKRKLKVFPQDTQQLRPGISSQPHQSQNLQSRPSTSAPLLMQPHEKKPGYASPASEILRHEEEISNFWTKVPTLPRAFRVEKNMQHDQAEEQFRADITSRPQQQAWSSNSSFFLRENKRPELAREPQRLTRVSGLDDSSMQFQLQEDALARQKDFLRAHQNSFPKLVTSHVPQIQTHRMLASPRQPSHFTVIPQAQWQGGPSGSVSFPGLSQPQQGRLPTILLPNSERLLLSDAFRQQLKDATMAARILDNPISVRSSFTAVEEREAWEDLGIANAELQKAIEDKKMLVEELMMQDRKIFSKTNSIKTTAKAEKKRPSHMMMDIIDHAEGFNEGGYGYGISTSWEDFESEEDDPIGDNMSVSRVAESVVSFDGSADEPEGAVMQCVENSITVDAAMGQIQRQVEKRGPGRPGRPSLVPFPGFHGQRS